MLMTHFIGQTDLKPSSVYEWPERIQCRKVLQCRQVGGVGDGGGGRTPRCPLLWTPQAQSCSVPSTRGDNSGRGSSIDMYNYAGGQ